MDAAPVWSESRWGMPGRRLLSLTLFLVEHKKYSSAQG